MFKFEVPVFVHKNVLKKEMLDELRDYPLQVSKMMLDGGRDGVLKGTGITWSDNTLKIQPGLILYGGNIYRMEEEWSTDCPAADQLTYIKVRFSTMGYERNRMGGMGDIYMDEKPTECGEVELGRFRLQEGARLRTEYENFDDYQTEFDTVNRIHVPYVCSGDVGLWPKLLMEYASELMSTATENIYDISYAMQVMAGNGQVAWGLTLWYVEKCMDSMLTDRSNLAVYDKLRHILRERRRGNNCLSRQPNQSRQMLLL